MPVGLKRRIFYSIVLALEVCHKAGVAHMDLKCDNILLSDHLIPTLCDFGLSRFYKDHNHNVGWTERYAAPETLKPHLLMPGHDWRV